MNNRYRNITARLRCALLAGAMLIAVLGVSAQDYYKATGRVVDKNGKPVAGAVINVSEQNRLVYSDINGHFTLDKVRPNDDIIVTVEGYNPAAITADLEKDMTIVLEDAGGRYDREMSLPFKNLKLKHVSASTTTMTGPDLERHPVNELENAFMGSLTGVVTYESRSQPGYIGNVAEKNFMYIRGLRTTNASARSPLIIVDNIERDIKFLDAFPIETVTVLKDAAATAIYGMRGANGVVFVTTKRGTPGKTDIRITQEVGFQNIFRMPEYQNAYNYALTYNRALYLDGKSQKYDEQDIAYYKMAVDGTIPDELKYKYVNTDWEKTVLREFAPQYRTNVNISGGGKSVRYFTSFSFNRQEGFYNKKWAEYNSWSTQHVYTRYNLRSNIDIDVSKRLNLSLDLGGRLDETSLPYVYGYTDSWGIFTWMAEHNPTQPILNPNGSFAVDQTTNKDNPAALIARSGLEKNRQRNLYTNLKADFDLDFITQGLSVKGIVGFDYYNVFRSWQTQAWDGFYFNPDTEEYSRMRTGTAGLSDPNTSPREMSYNINLMGWLDYSRTFGDHNVNAMAIMRAYKNVVPDFKSSTRYLTYNGIVNYIWRDRLAFQGVATIMGSDNYRKGDRYGFFPGASVSYNLAGEDFMKRAGFVNLLKPRISYGRTGQNNTGVRAYPYQSQYQEGGGYNFGTSQAYLQGTYEQAAGNLNTKWEISDMLNAGLDFDFWNSKLYGSIDVFKEWRSNILVNRSSLNDLLGIASIPMDSYGKVETKGVEAVLGHSGRIRDFRYNIEANVTYNTNKIIDIDEVAPQYSYQAVTGGKIDQPLLYIFDKYFQTPEEIASSPKQVMGTKPGHGKYKNMNGDNAIDQFDMVRTGYNHIPEIVTGFNIGMEWRGISAKVLLVGQFNRWVALRENVDAGFFWTGKSTKEATKSWGYYTNDPNDRRNINALYPRLTTERTHDRDTYQASTLWWKNGNLLSIRNVELGYSLPKSVVSKMGMSELRFYVSGYNLYTFDKLDAFDAENPMNFIWGYPKSRIFSLGINIGF